MITEQEIIKVVANALGVDIAKLTLDTATSDLDEWDSLGHIALIQELEIAFDGRFTANSRLASAISIKELLDALNSQN